MGRSDPRHPTTDTRLPFYLTLLLFAAARIPLLIVRAPFFDELFTRWISAKPFAGIVAALRQDSGPSLYYFVMHLLGDPSVAVTRVLSLLCGAVALILILRSGRTTAALLLAVLPPAILFAADARAYAMCALFVTIAVLAIDDDRPFAASLALVAAAYSHYYGVLLFPILFLGNAANRSAANRSAGGPPAGPPAARRRWWYAPAIVLDIPGFLLGRAAEPAAVQPAGRRRYGRRLLAPAIALVLYIPGFLLALHQPAEARAWMTTAWPDALFIRPPIALAIIGAIVLAMAARVNRYLVMVLVPLILAIMLRVYVPMRFEAVVATPIALWLAASLQKNRFRLALTTALVSICIIWTALGILDHASRPPDPYRQAALWVAANIPANETIVASGYCYLETIMNGHSRVAAFPPEQGMHPGWRALPKPGLRAPAGAFFWTGERNAPELAVIARERRIIEPLFVNDRALVALVR